MTRTLKNHAYAAARIVTLTDGSTALQSYNTFVIEVDPEGWLTCRGLFSRTTIKHIGWFMRELYGLNYYDAKACYEKEYQLNVYTGKIRSLA